MHVLDKLRELGSNCTLLELKQLSLSCRWIVLSRSNCTLLELKRTSETEKR